MIATNNMPLKKLCCSLELAKRLDGLGLPQESLFYWRTVGEKYAKTLKEFPFSGALMGDGSPIIQYAEDEEHAPMVQYEHKFSAYTAGELGELLPEIIKGSELDYSLNIWKEYAGWGVGYHWVEDTRGVVIVGDREVRFTDESLVDAMAKMLIYLIENGLYEPTK